MTYLILQPNGKYAIWETVSDEFSGWNIDQADVIEAATAWVRSHEMEHEISRYQRHLTSIKETGLAAEFAMNWDEAVRYICHKHGPTHELLCSFRAAGLPVTEPRRCPLCAKGYENVFCDRCKRHVCDECGYLPDDGVTFVL